MIGTLELVMISRHYARILLANGASSPTHSAITVYNVGQGHRCKGLHIGARLLLPQKANRREGQKRRTTSEKGSPRGEAFFIPFSCPPFAPLLGI